MYVAAWILEYHIETGVSSACVRLRDGIYSFVAVPEHHLKAVNNVSCLEWLNDRFILCMMSAIVGVCSRCSSTSG